MHAIIKHVDPYHARCYHNGEEVVKFDGATPVEWIVSKHETKEEAQEALWDLACNYETNRDNLQYENDSQKKEGIYYCESGWPMMLRGDSSFSFDVEHFRIEEM